nr:MAG TPA: SECRETED 45 KDA PROTEIN CYCLE, PEPTIDOGLYCAN, CHAP, CELL [Caudoviricetes sp.]
MKLKEIESKKIEIEKEVLKTEQQLDNLVVDIATLEAQIKSKNRKVIDLTERISSKRAELRKLEIAKEIMQSTWI